MHFLTLFVAFLTVRAEIQECLRDIRKIYNISNIFNNDEYAIMAKSSGWKLNDLGSYEDCANLDSADYLLVQLMPFTAAYVAICGSKNCTQEDYSMLLQNFTETVEVVHESNKLLNESRRLYLKNELGLGSKSGNIVELENGMRLIYSQSYIQEHFSELNWGQIVMISIFILVIIITIIGTTLDLLNIHRLNQISQKKLVQSDKESALIELEEPNSIPIPPPSPSLSSKLLICFSLYTNTQKLFISRSSEKTGSKETLDIFNSVRVLSLGWVVMGHLYQQRSTNSAVTNPSDMMDYFKYTKAAILYSGVYSVDTFFWLAGFLMGYLFILEYNTKKRMNWVYLYIHRFYRILPAYMFVFFTVWAFLKYLGNGPLWFKGDELNNQCHDYWWTNVLFVNNFVPDGDGNFCFGWSWYLANDIQFFLITPIILHIYHARSKIAGWGIFMMLIGVHIVSNWMIADHYEYPVAMLGVGGDSFYKQYVKPYCRIGPYILGIIFGIIYYTKKLYARNGDIYDKLGFKIVKLYESRYVRYISYLAGLFLINFIIFIQQPAYESATKRDDYSDDWSQSQRNAYLSVSRVGWGLGLGLFFQPILLGYNQFLVNILGADFWTPLARISFCGYLVHFGFVYAYVASEYNSYYFSDTTFFYDFIILVIITLLAALPITLLIESPFMALERTYKQHVASSKPQRFPERALKSK